MFSAESQSPTRECSLLEYVQTFSIPQSLQSLTVPELYGVVDVSAADLWKLTLFHDLSEREGKKRTI
jgi:hypothetical protein